MHGEIEDWKNGWFGVSLGLSVPEIDRLITLLTAIRSDPEQHFHITSDYSGAGGLGDVEIYVASAETSSNLHLSSIALPAGTGSPSPDA